MISFISFLLKNRLVIIINLLIVMPLATWYVFFYLKKEYAAEITFLPPIEEKDMGSSILSLAATQMMSLSLKGITPNQIESIFNSNAIKKKVIDRFDLYTLFKLKKKKNRQMQAMRRIKKYVMMEVREKGSMGFSEAIAFTMRCYYTSPDSARDMVDYTFWLLDSTVRSISVDKARRNRVFVEEQLNEQKRSYDVLQKNFTEFQQANKAYNIPEQLKHSLNNFAQIKTMYLLNEIKIKSLKMQFGSSVPELVDLMNNQKIYDQQLDSIEQGTIPDVLPGLSYSSTLLPQYLNYLRDLEVQNQLILYLTKEVEQARIQESKNISPLMIIDPSFVPEYKARPRRIVLMGIIILAEFVACLFVLFYWYYFTAVLQKNPTFQNLRSELRRK